MLKISMSQQQENRNNLIIENNTVIIFDYLGRVVCKNPNTFRNEYGDFSSSLRVNSIFGLIGYTHLDSVKGCVIQYHERYNYIVRLITFTRYQGNIVQIELRKIKNNYVWWMRQTKGFNSCEGYYRNDVFTYIFLKSLCKVKEGDEKIRAKACLDKFVSDTSFDLDEYLKKECISIESILLYAVFIDEREWKYVEEDDGGCYGYNKTIRDLGYYSDIYYVSGSHLTVGGVCEYDYTMRAAIGKYIEKE